MSLILNFLWLHIYQVSPLLWHVTIILLFSSTFLQEHVKYVWLRALELHPYLKFKKIVRFSSIWYLPPNFILILSILKIYLSNCKFLLPYKLWFHCKKILYMYWKKGGSESVIFYTLLFLLSLPFYLKEEKREKTMTLPLTGHKGNTLCSTKKIVLIHK